MERRTFLQLLGGGLMGLSFVAGPRMPAAGLPAEAGVPDPSLKKAVNLNMVQADLPLSDKFQLLKDLGFDGVELNSPNDLDRAAVLAAREKTGLRIHGVVDAVHWQQTLGDPDPAVRAAGREGLVAAIEDAHAYGANTVLLVPAVVTQEIPYDQAYTRSQAEIRTVLPIAEENEIIIAVENVWNRFLYSPLEMTRYIDELESPWVRSYFDVGNVVTFGWPEQWIRILGTRIAKVHIKEYSRAKRDAEGPYAGFKVPLGEGDVDWAAVRAALQAEGYLGWATAEVPGGDPERLREIASRMNRLLHL
ncbi:MAG TPA: sugar phosphate isomerase/epimerase family protein [Gammaproteobacteria bacterium]|nr:sugar phosphate isomerase/epimerase family protein [Gammaproteobacteria bacterium]